MATETKEKTSRKKEVSKRAPQGPMPLSREDQTTIFNTELSKAADAWAKSTKELRLWKERNAKDKRDLITQMKAEKLTTMRMGDDKIIKYKYTDAKEDIILKDYKAKSPRRRGRFNGI